MLQISLHSPKRLLLNIYQDTTDLFPGKGARFRANVKSKKTVMIKTTVACGCSPLYLGKLTLRGTKEWGLVSYN